MPDNIERPCTPPPPTRIITPPAPRMGYLDSWDPYATPAHPRKSARISSQRTVKRSSSPNGHNQQNPSTHLTSEDSHQQPTSSETSSMPPLQRKRQPAPDSVRRAPRPGMKIDDNSTETGSSMKAKTVQRSSVSRTKGMLLTPSKTPRKPDAGKQVSGFGPVARELFAAESDELTPRKRQKKYTGISLESFTAEEIEEPFDIFTDSRDRLPAKDESAENPFYGEVAVPETPKRRSKRSVKIPGEGAQSVDAAARREDGMLYVFRGKKFFRKFTDDEPEEVDEHEESDAEEEVEASLGRPPRRSAIKPRLLFQTEKTPAMIEEEEAPTDVEDLHEEADEEECPQTPVKETKRAGTPEAPKFAPVSPPDTKRTTRSMNKLLDEGTPMRKFNVRRTTSFDTWRRTKDSKPATSTKRAAESQASGPAKRTRT